MAFLRKIFLIVLLEIMFAVVAISSNQMKFRYYKVENGISSNTIHTIFQDSKGYVWIGTSDGLNRFDSYNFCIYRQHTDQSRSIGNNSAHCIFEDSEGRIWIGTEDGVFIYDYQNDTFSAYPLTMGKEIVHNAFVYSIAEDKHSNIWISTLGNGLFKCNLKNKASSNYLHNKADTTSISSDYVSKVLVDSEGNVWLAATGNVLNMYEPQRDCFSHIPIVDRRKQVSEKNLFTMCEDSFGNLWLAGWGSGIFKFDRQKRSFYNFLTTERIPLINGRIHTIKQFAQGTLLIGSDQGLTTFNTTKETYVQTSFDKDNQNGLNDFFVYDICIDKEGGLWVGTYFGGINYSPPNSSKFKTYSNDSKKKVQGRVISKFCEDPKSADVWIGTDDGGLFRFNPTTGTSRPVTVDKELQNINIHALCADGVNLWVGTYGRGLYCLDTQSGRTVNFLTFMPNGTQNESVYSIYKDLNGLLWIGTKTGIYTFDVATNTFDCIEYLGYNSDILDISEDNCGSIWFASLGKGVFRYDQKSKKMQRYYIGAEQTPFVSNHIRSLCFYKDRIWIGTAGSGLHYFDSVSEKFVVENGLSDYNSNSTIYNIIADNNYLWLTTNYGLVKYDILNSKINLYNQEDGLLTSLFNPNSGIKTSSGDIYIGASSGFNVFDPQDVVENKVVPQVVFTGLQIHNQNVQIGDDSPLKTHINHQRKITLRSAESVLSIEFVALSFCAPEKNRYKYILQGFDTNWISLSNKIHKITYTNLSAGRYVLMVTASNNDGVWSPVESIEIIIRPPWWGSNLTIFIYVLLLGATAVCLYIWLLGRSKSRHSMQLESLQQQNDKKMDESKINFFTNIAHEIRTPVTLISAPIEEIFKDNNIPANITENLIVIKNNSDRLLDLVNQMLDFRKTEQEIYNINGISTNLCETTKQIIARFATQAKHSGIDLEFICDTHTAPYANIDPESYTKILSNLLTNALKFTRDTIIVTISNSALPNAIVLTVTDNGMGIKEEDQENIFSLFYHNNNSTNLPLKGFGIGLSIVSLLVNRINATIEVVSEYAKYASFIVTIPVGKSSEQEEDEVQADRSNRMLDSIKVGDTILIVDDNKDLLDFMIRVLEKSYTVFKAYDGVQALEVLEHQRIDVIVSDVMMPVMDGFELCSKIKHNINLSHIPIILLTAKVDTDAKIEGLESGADVYIEKPVSMSYLTAQVNSLLSKRHAMRESFGKMPFVPLSSISLTKADEVFVQKISDIIDKNISNAEFSVDDLAQEICMSRSVLYAKVRAISDVTPKDFIRLIRLRKAAEYLNKGEYKVNEICYLVGFGSPSYFARCFYNQFGVLPKGFVNQQKSNKT